MFDKLYFMFGPDPFDGLRDGAVSVYVSRQQEWQWSSACPGNSAYRTRMAGGESLDCQDWNSKFGKRDAPCPVIQLLRRLVIL